MKEIKKGTVQSKRAIFENKAKSSKVPDPVVAASELEKQSKPAPEVDPSTLTISQKLEYFKRKAEKLQANPSPSK